MTASVVHTGRAAATIRLGALAGVAGGCCIWLYEAVVWVGVQHTLPLAGIPSNATGLVFGQAFKASLGPGAFALGTAIHFAFAAAWGVLFAVIWPFFRRRGIEATLVALGYAALAWVVMHLAIMAATTDHPNYADPTVIIGGIMSHLFFTVPMALIVKAYSR